MERVQRAFEVGLAMQCDLKLVECSELRTTRSAGDLTLIDVSCRCFCELLHNINYVFLSAYQSYKLIDPLLIVTPLLHLEFAIGWEIRIHIFQAAPLNLTS